MFLLVLLVVVLEERNVVLLNAFRSYFDLLSRRAESLKDNCLLMLDFFRVDPFFGAIVVSDEDFLLGRGFECG